MTLGAKRGGTGQGGVKHFNIIIDRLSRDFFRVGRIVAKRRGRREKALIRERNPRALVTMTTTTTSAVRIGVPIRGMGKASTVSLLSLCISIVFDNYNRRCPIDRRVV